MARRGRRLVSGVDYPDSWRDTGGLWPYGIPVGQSWLEIGAIIYAIQTYKVRQVIELGCHRCGLGSLLAARALFDPGFAYLGIESAGNVLDGDVIPRMESLPMVYVRQGDVFSSATLDRVARHVQAAPGPVLIYCDDGDKPREVAAYAPLLRKGDLIAAHDCAPAGTPRGANAEINDDDLAALGPDWTRLRPWWLEATTIGMVRRR